jgi:hypothetical protein
MSQNSTRLQIDKEENTANLNKSLELQKMKKGQQQRR